jgi:hypothetical protein
LTWINLESGRPLKTKTLRVGDDIRIRIPAQASKYGWLAALARK